MKTELDNRTVLSDTRQPVSPAKRTVVSSATDVSSKDGMAFSTDESVRESGARIIGLYKPAFEELAK